MKNLILPILYLASLITLISFATSCSTMQNTYKPNYKYLKDHKDQYQWTCSKF